MTAVKSVTDYPSFTRYLLVVFKSISIHHEADQRSISAPGHGFGAYTEEVSSTEVYAYPDEDELRAHIERLYQEVPSRKDFLILVVEGTKSVSRQVILK